MPENPKITERPQAKPNTAPDGHDYIPFLRLGISADDLVEATGLDIYRFRIDVAKGEKFRVLLRSQDSKESPARELVDFSFEKESDGSGAVIGVSFLRRDRKLSGFLLSEEADGEYRLKCVWL